MSWTSGIWPAVGWRRKQHALDLHEACEERVKARTEGVAWGDKLTAVGNWSGPAERVVHDELSAQLAAATRTWADTTGAALTTRVNRAACRLPNLEAFGVESGFMRAWARAANMQDKLNQMTLEMLYVQGSGSSAGVDGWTSNRLDYESHSPSSGEDTLAELDTFVAADKAAENYTVSDDVFSSLGWILRRFIIASSYSIFEEVEEYQWRAYSETVNAEYFYDSTWTGRNSRAYLFGEVLAYATQNAHFHQQGFPVTLTENVVNELWDEGASSTDALRSVRLEDEAEPVMADAYVLGDVNESHTEADISWGWGFNAFDLFFAIDWSVSGGFAYQ